MAANANEEENKFENADVPDGENALAEEQPASSTARRQRLFTKELRSMMYGLGDAKNPYIESVDFMEDLVVHYITEMTHKAMDIKRKGRLRVEHIVFLVRKDPQKYARIKDLLTTNEKLKKVRKAFDLAKMAKTKVAKTKKAKTK